MALWNSCPAGAATITASEYRSPPEGDLQHRLLALRHQFVMVGPAGSGGDIDVERMAVGHDARSQRAGLAGHKPVRSLRWP